LVLGFLHGVRGAFTDDVLETAVGPSSLGIFSEDGTHSGFYHVVGKFTSHTMQKPQNQKTTIISW
jgi:hypothetical protein